MRRIALVALCLASAVVRADRPKLARSVALDGGAVSGLALDRTGTTAVAHWHNAEGRHELRAYDLERGTLRWRRPVVASKTPSALAFGSDGSTVYFHGRLVDARTYQPDADVRLTLLSTDSGHTRRTLGLEASGPIAQMKVFDSGHAERVAFVSGEALYVVAPAERDPLEAFTLLPEKQGPWFVAVRPPKGRAPAVVAAVSRHGFVHAFELHRETRELCEMGEVNGSVAMSSSNDVEGVAATAFAPDGESLLVFGRRIPHGPQVLRYRLADRTFEPVPGERWAGFFDPAAFVPAGSLVLTGYGAAMGGRELSAASFSSDGATLVLGKHGALSSTCAHALLLEGRLAPDWHPLENAGAGEAWRAQVAVSGDGARAVVARDFGSPSIPTGGPMQLDVWHLPR